MGGVRVGTGCCVWRRQAEAAGGQRQAGQAGGVRRVSAQSAGCLSTTSPLSTHSTSCPMPSSSDMDKMEGVEAMDSVSQGMEAVTQDDVVEGTASNVKTDGEAVAVSVKAEGKDSESSVKAEGKDSEPSVKAEGDASEASMKAEGGDETSSENTDNPASSTHTITKEVDEEKGDGEGKEEDVDGATKKDAKSEPRKSVEKNVGITEYAGDHAGFFGIIKQRYCDFIVNEVNSGGEIVCITEQMVPHEPEEIPCEPVDLPPELTPEKIKELNKLAGVREPLRLSRVPPPSLGSEATGGAEEDAGKADESLDTDTEKLLDDQDTSMKDENEKEKEYTSMEEEGEKEYEEKEKMEEHEDDDDDEEDHEDEEEEHMQDEDDEAGMKEKGEESETQAKDSDQKERTERENGESVKPKTSPKPRAHEVLINVDKIDKEGRTAIHRAVKAKYRTVDSVYRELPDGSRYIVVRRKKASAIRRDKSLWPKAQMYTTFVLYKENVDTMEAINHIAWKIRVKPNNFGYAGTKDKRAKTSQLVSVSRVPPHKLWNATRFHRGIELGNFRFRPTPQKLGQLRGNHFRIVLREVKGADEVITSAIESLKVRGFINYYGPQRFGTTSIPTHTIGKELLKSNWQQAINLILLPRENDIPELNRCRKKWKKTGDADAALRSLPKGWESSVEAQLLKGLVQLNSNDLVGALGRIPRNTRLLYLHAYQSFLWNTVASRRIQKYGLKVLPGDIVRVKDHTVVEEELPVTTPFDTQGSGGEGEKVGTHWWNEEVTRAVQEKKEAYALKMQTEGALEDESNDGNESDTENGTKEDKVAVEGEASTKPPNLHFLTEEEAEKTDICEVLLPLPGYNVEYPKNEMKEWYEELLQADGLSFDSLKHRVKAYAVGGVYRRLLVRPSNVAGTICYYRDPTKPLIQSDIDKLRGIDMKDNVLTEGPNKGVIVEMTLPSSSYATVALRELLKMETSSQFQATLNTVEYTPRNRDFSSRRGRGGGREDAGVWRVQGQGFRGSWRGHGDGGPWHQGRGRGGDRGGYRGGFRGGRDYGWGGGRGGWRGRGEKRPRRGGDMWNPKRGRF
ncbi:pseudouridylate synthase 7 homolog isoform X4 [Portunus trituberculatus]|uniref:pseudouridylate synthase 7 homolog isoform X4 n=1 Tax=Portunus trituberculatus TaxID=210409 RepID=UPI001E1CF6E8|nr:pseudouridylate synthase 7 homolog isoform X4 [Portunus trituberculatus]